MRQMMQGKKLQVNKEGCTGADMSRGKTSQIKMHDRVKGHENRNNMKQGVLKEVTQKQNKDEELENERKGTNLKKYIGEQGWQGSAGEQAWKGGVNQRIEEYSAVGMKI